MRRTRHARSAIGAQLAAQHADRIGALLQGPVIPSLHGREAEPDRIGVGHSQLAARTERANRIGADLFPSIHHDDVQEIYHAKWTYDGAPHSYSDRFSGYSLFLSRENRHFDDSLAFAKLLEAALTECGLAYSAHHAEPIRGEGRQLIDKALGIYRYDQLFVLRFNAAPAVLLEAGIIVNRADEVVLASPEGQARIGAGRRRHRLVKWRPPEKGV